MSTTLIHIGASTSGLLLVVAGVAKFRDTAHFARLLYDYRIVPSRFVRAMSIAIPSAEVVIGVAQALGLGQAYAGIAGAILFIAFAGAIATNLIRGRSDVSCGCFGVYASAPLRWRLVWQNMLMAIVGIAWSAQVWISGTISSPPGRWKMLMCGLVILSFAWLGSLLRSLFRKGSTGELAYHGS